MKKLVLFFVLFAGVAFCKAQDHPWAFGFYGDVQLKSPSYNGAFGVQGKYDFTNHSALQAQVYGRNGYVAVGADYLLGILDKKKSNFNVFLGAGVSQDFYRYNEVTGKETIPESRDNHTVANGQIGASYYFPEVDLSLYAGYKAKYHFDWDKVDANFVMFGVRYHLW